MLAAFFLVSAITSSLTIGAHGISKTRSALRLGRTTGALDIESELRLFDGISANTDEPASTGFASLRRKSTRPTRTFMSLSQTSWGRPTAAASSAPREPSNTTVWIAGWPRSGSTTMFEMVLAAALEEKSAKASADDNTMLLEKGNEKESETTTSRSHFGLFEPCHWGLGNNTPPDVYDKDLQGDCGKIMDRLVNCDFSGVKFLFGWSRFAGPHTDISGINIRENKFTSETAENSCHSSNLVVYKTVTEFGRNVDNLLPVLDAHPNLLALVPVRDPRGIYASWKLRPWGVGGVGFLLDICKQHKANLLQKHPRLRRVVYERLASNPVEVMQKAFQFLGLDFGEPQMKWINQTFDSDCDGKETGDFSTCHHDSQEPQTRWHKSLTHAEKQAFKNDAACREVAIAYGYEL